MEKLLFDKKYGEKVIGCDEAGRGPWCGPVVVASAIIEDESLDFLHEINDSKKLTEKKRFDLWNKIKLGGVRYEVEIIEPELIDEINILEASRLGMKKTSDKLIPYGDIILADYMMFESDLEVIKLAKGDTLSLAIGVASIIAKCVRDELMYTLDEQFPEYNFGAHKGYGTKKHVAALQEFGVIKGVYRETYKPVAKLIAERGYYEKDN